MPSGASDLAGPAAVGDVEQQRAGRVGDVGGALAGQAVADVVLRQQHRARRAPTAPARACAPTGAWAAVKPVSAGLQRQLDQARRADSLGDLVALGAVRWSHQSSAGRTTSPARRAATSRASARKSPTAAIRRASIPAVGERAADGFAGRAPPVRRILLGPARSAARRMATCSVVADATMRPDGSITSARVPPVPTSMPRRCLDDGGGVSPAGPSSVRSVYRRDVEGTFESGVLRLVLVFQPLVVELAASHHAS